MVGPLTKGKVTKDLVTASYLIKFGPGKTGESIFYFMKMTEQKPILIWKTSVEDH